MSDHRTSKSAALKARFIVASGWAVSSQIYLLALRFGSSLIMTRLMMPEAFGIIAVVTSISLVAALLSDVGIRQSVVNSPNGDDQRMLDTAWSMQIVRGMIIWVLCLLLASSIYQFNKSGWLANGSVYSEEILPLLLAVSSFNSVILGFESTKRYTQERRLEQKPVVLIETTSSTLGILTTVLLGYLTGSIWSIIFGGFIGSITSVILGHLLLPGVSNRLVWDSRFLKEILRFGRWVFGSSVLFVLSSNIDKLLLGLWIAPASLGCYIIAQSLSISIEGIIGRIVNQNVSPLFRNVLSNSPIQIRLTYLRVRVLFDSMYFCWSGFVFYIAPALVATLYDYRYGEIGEMLQFLSISAITARHGVSAAAYLALGAPHALTLMSLARLTVISICMPLVYFSVGIDFVYWVIAFHGFVVIPIVWWFDRHFDIFNWRAEIIPPMSWVLGWGTGAIAVYFIS
jgi:O-antigen/teichoic acid export membrane protein